ncbi:MAG: DUF2497 domain-containing protein [Holosporaceae bacterium]|jgi:cell pole-organizing protein PopZ|nr:DUF2497 domain-containing protein [Holosporaceae bacterium]
MVDTNAEMSLDEVLSSIKKMVMDDEPPVLDLTDMVTQDGTVVKVEKSSDSEGKNPDMSSFLRLIQEGADNVPSDESGNGEPLAHKQKTSVAFENLPPNNQNRQDLLRKNETLADLIRGMIRPLVQKWINDNLPAIASKIVEAEVRRLLQK